MSQESKLVSFEVFWNTVSNHKNGFCIDIGSQEGKEHSIEVHSAYYRDVVNNPLKWLTFSNHNHPVKDEKTGKDILQMEQLGTFEFDIGKIISITDLNEEDRMDRFDIESPKAYHLEFSDGNDVYIGLCFYGK